MSVKPCNILCFLEQLGVSLTDDHIQLFCLIVSLHFDSITNIAGNKYSCG